MNPESDDVPSGEAALRAERAALAARLAEADPRLQARIAGLNLRLGDHAAAKELADAALKGEPDLVPAHRVVARSAYRLGLNEDALASCRRLVELNPRDSLGHVLHLSILIDTGRFAEAQDCLSRLVTRGLDDVRVLAMATRMVVNEDVLTAALAAATAVTTDDDRTRRRAALTILEHFGQPAPAALLAGRADIGLPKRAALQGPDTPRDDELRRLLIVGDHTDTRWMLVAPARDHAGIVIVFTGLADGVSVPLETLDRYFAALGLSAIYLRDFTRRIFLGGIPSLGDGYHALLRSLRTMITELGGGPVTTFGNSAGGFAAIRYGVDLEVDAILSFSGPTNLTSDFWQDDGRAKLLMRRARELEPDMLVLRTLLLGRAKTQLVVAVYGEQHVKDRRHAEQLRDLPGVELHPIRGYAEHFTLRRMIETGTLSRFLKQRLALRERD